MSIHKITAIDSEGLLRCACEKGAYPRSAAGHVMHVVTLSIQAPPRPAGLLAEVMAVIHQPVIDAGSPGNTGVLTCVCGAEGVVNSMGAFTAHVIADTIAVTAEVIALSITRDAQAPSRAWNYPDFSAPGVPDGDWIRMGYDAATAIARDFGPPHLTAGSDPTHPWKG